MYPTYCILHLFTLMHLADTFIQIHFAFKILTLSARAFPGNCTHALLLELQQCNIEMHVCVDEEGSGAVRAAAAEDGCGGGRAQRGREVHPVEDAAGGAGQDGPRGQTVHHEPESHATPAAPGPHRHGHTRVVRRGPDVLCTTGGARATG